jgi:hypothetical protein
MIFSKEYSSGIGSYRGGMSAFSPRDRVELVVRIISKVKDKNMSSFISIPMKMGKSSLLTIKSIKFRE